MSTAKPREFLANRARSLRIAKNALKTARLQHRSGPLNKRSDIDELVIVFV
jgi:hypothetical protein